MFSAAFLLGAAGCGANDFSMSGGPGRASALSSADPNEIASSESDSSSRLSASHETENSAVLTPIPEVLLEDGGEMDLLRSSPYYSGQEALLQDICHISTRKPPEHFPWLNEETVRETWGIDGYISAGCLDFVARFDFDRGEEGALREQFYVLIAMFPGVQISLPEGNSNLEYTVLEGWTPAEGHPGFETQRVKVTRFLAAGSQLDAVALPNELWVRWEMEGFQMLLQMPESGVDDFWENIDRLFEMVESGSVELPPYKREGSFASPAESTEE